MFPHVWGFAIVEPDVASSNIFAQYLQPARSVLDYSNDYAKADQLRNQNAMQAMTLQQAADAQAQRNALRAAVQGGQIDLTSAPGQAQALATAPDVAPALISSVQSGLTSAAKAKLDTASAGEKEALTGKTKQDTAIVAHQQHLQALATVNTPQDAVQWVVDGVRSGTLPEQGLPQALQAIQAASASPQAFAQWKAGVQQSGVTVQQQLEMTAPKPTEMRLGNVVKTIDMNPRSQSFGQEIVGAQNVGISPDAQLSSETSRANNAATIGSENSRAAAQRATQLQIAGLGENGQISPNLEAEAQLVAAGRAAPPTGMAATRPAAATLMARVAQINPDYDATTYGAKLAAAKGFTSGQQGNALRSIATANEHLSQLDTLGDALQNGQLPVVNQIANQFGVQTGAAPAQVFNAVKGVVAQEVVKAIIAGGGSVGEREEAAKAFSAASSPAQLKQTIAAYRTVMGAQQANLMEQRRAAGLSDATAPRYGGAGATPAAASSDVPADIAAILAKHGGAK